MVFVFSTVLVLVKRITEKNVSIVHRWTLNSTAGTRSFRDKVIKLMCPSFFIHYKKDSNTVYSRDSSLSQRYGLKGMHDR